jgi:serine/threonine protein kinase
MAFWNGRPLGEDDPSGLSQDHTWLGSVHLGNGGNGAVHYWLKVDQNRKILDRMVIKDLWCKDLTIEPPAYKGIYKDLVYKGMDFGVNPDRPGNATVDERFFREAYLQGLLTDINNPSSSNTVSLRGYKKGDKHKQYTDKNGEEATETHWRLYLDLLHAGDLDNLIEEHTVKDKDDSDKRNPVLPIPEPYIWWVFTCIAEALLQLETVVQARPNARQEQDEVIAFVDMKPANMLLGSYRGDHYPVYPKPLLSDFGAGHILYKGDPRQDERHEATYFHGATLGFFPPEMKVRTVDGIERGIYNKPLYSWTNVWQTGRTIECMMRLKQRLLYEYVSPHFSLVTEDSWLNEDPPKFEEFPNFSYSKDLVDLVWRCQRLNPEDRPTPAELLKLIKERAPKHHRDMDKWGNATWIQEQETKTKTHAKTYAGVTKRSESMKKRNEAGKLGFLNAYPPEWAKRYHDLDMDLPTGCEMLFYGKKDFAKVNTQAVIPPKKKFPPNFDVKW